MKKLFAILLALCMLPLHALAAPYFEYIEAVIANPNVADRLILRDKPDKNGKILGRFYSGTPVVILAEEGEWCKVTLGSLIGYMMRAYLEYELPNYDLPKLFYTAATKKADAPIYNKASTSSKVDARANGDVYVLGDINDDWRYVKCGKSYGYMRTVHLNTTDMHIPLAYLSTKVELYEDHQLTKKNGLVYRAGTPVQVLDASRNGNWASIQILGLPGTENIPAMGGYISQDYLNIFVWPWEAETKTYTIGKTKEEILLDPSIGARYTAAVPKDTPVKIIGYTDTHYHVVCGDGQGIVPKEKISYVKSYSAGNTHMEWEGYVLLDQKSEKTWQFPSLTRLIFEDNDVLYVEWGFGQQGKMDKQDVTILLNRDLDNNCPSLSGDFKITDKNSAIWHFVVPEGKQATLSMENEAWGIRMENQVFTEGAYSFFLPAGTRGTLENAVFSSSRYNIPDIRLYTCHAEWAAEPVFQGSGRFFCDWHFAFDGNWYGFKALPMPGCEESYFIISDLAHPGEGRKVDLHHLEFEEENRFTPQPGQFIQLHNCILYYDFGNG